MSSEDVIKENQESRELICIPKSEYKTLQDRSDWLMCLEHAGVDNWSGYSFAIDLKEEYELDDLIHRA